MKKAVDKMKEKISLLKREYAIEALEKHGVVKGSLLAIFRILRCNPFSKGGYDPVPEVRKGKRCKK